MKTRIFAVLMAIIPTAAVCATLHVPSDYSTIAEALAASAPGDEVVIVPATYFEHGIAIGHTLVVRSAVPGERAVIDGQGLGPVMVVDVSMDDAHVSIFDIGFVNGTNGIDVEVQFGLEVTLVRCLINQNANSGFHSSSPNPFYSPLLSLQNCEISQNAGRGIFVQASRSLSVVDCQISENGDTGVFVVGSTFQCVDSRITANAGSQMGGGASLVASDVEMLNVDFDGNSAAVAGGGISIHADGDYVLNNCSFANCTAPVAAQAYIHSMDGYVIDATFNCCEVDTSQFGGPVWEAGSVAITHDGCDVGAEAVNWGSLKAMFR